MRVLLLSAYDAASHRHWRETLAAGLADWDWTQLALPPRHFNWRVRSNPLTWSQQQRELLERSYDLVLATSMVDLATLRGLVPALAGTPTLLYFHENQFDYPDSERQRGRLEIQMVSLYAALAADALLFNSAYNQRSFLEGCESMLAAFPDHVPSGVVAGLADKSMVLPVPLPPAEPATAATAPEPDCLQILWNHRWEYDKGPEQLLAVASELAGSGLRFRLHVAGQQFRHQPESFEALQALLVQSDCAGQWGFVPQRANYAALLARCDVVLSTAWHDFQGLSLLEACAAGCSPLAPARLAYPEWLPPQFLYSGDDPAAEARACAKRLLELAALKAAGRSLPRADVSALSCASLLPRYRDCLHSHARDKTVS